MLKQTALAVIVGLAVLAPAVPAQAQTPAPGAGQTAGPLTLKNFQVRIQRGVKAGTITPQELRRLRRDLSAFRTKAQAKRQSGGTLTPAERRQLRQELRRISRKIYRANHNRIKKGPVA